VSAPAASRGEGSVEARVSRFDWAALAAELDAEGSAVLPGLLTAEACERIAALYDDEARFRSQVIMGRHGYGQGEYRYFAYPLPDRIQDLRAALYPRLAPVANAWNAALGIPTRYPPSLEAFLQRCHAAGQSRPTPLLLRYAPGDYNRLHQDLYGEHVFPLQVSVLLSAPGRDFTGGEVVLTEQRPRMQSRAEVAPLAQGDGLMFAVRERPVIGPRGASRAQLRHGVSRLRSGRRFTLGIIFHDAA
jgi:uncharacterized protein